MQTTDSNPSGRLTGSFPASGRQVSPAKSFDDIIAGILVEKKYVSAAELDKYRQICAATKKRLGTLLLENNVLSRRDLYALVLSQMKNKDLPTVLVEEKFISFDELTRVFMMKKGDIRKLGKYLVASKILSEENLAESFAKAFDLSYTHPAALKPVKQTPSEIDPSFLTTFLSVITKINEEKKEVEFAICDPSNIGDIVNSNYLVDYRLSFTMTSFSAIQTALEKMFPKNPVKFEFEEFGEIEVRDTIEEFENARPTKSASGFPKRLLEIITDNKNPKVNPLFKLIYDAEREGSSEVHFEAFSDRIKIFFRRANRYFDVRHHITPGDYDYMVAKVKHMSRLNYEEERIFQSGSFTLEISGLKLFVSVLTVPTLFGENMVLRLLPLNHFPKPLDRYFKRQKGLLENIRKVLGLGGLIFLASNDNFSLTKLYYSLLNDFARKNEGHKIVSIERDIIIPLKNVIQMEYFEGSSAVSNLRTAHEAAINLGADIIASSVVHDIESFDFVSSTAAVAGTTLLCSSAPGIRALLSRIVTHRNARDIINSTSMILAAKSLNFICQQCREEDRDESVRKGFKVYRGSGMSSGKTVCPKCGGTGVAEHSFVFEALELKSKERKALFTAIKDPAKVDKAGTYETFEVMANELYREGQIVL